MSNKVLPIVLLASTAAFYTASAQASNVALNAPVTLNGGSFGTGGGGWTGGTAIDATAISSITDGLTFTSPHQWNVDTVWWDESNQSGLYLEIALGGSYLINQLIVQADNNDSYRIDYSNAGSAWITAWAIPATGGWGMQTRDSGLLSAFSADTLRFYATGGDSLYSVSEIQAFGTATPIPAAIWLFGSGLAGLMGLSRRRNQAVAA